MIIEQCLFSTCFRLAKLNKYKPQPDIKCSWVIKSLIDINLDIMVQQKQVVGHDEEIGEEKCLPKA